MSDIINKLHRFLHDKNNLLLMRKQNASETYLRIQDVTKVTIVKLKDFKIVCHWLRPIFFRHP